jgi:iron complex transport system substrate-binding protein
VALRHILAVPLLLAACSRDGAVTLAPVADDWGRSVSLAAPARRIVSLSPATTELVFAMGLGDRLVGRTSWCDWPAAARAVPDVGNGLGPNVEAVVARHPDLVVLYASEANRQALGRFDALGVATVALRLDTRGDLRRAARLLGALTARGAAAEAFLAAFDSAVAASSAAVRAARTVRPRVYVAIEPNPPITVGAGSFLSELIALGGGVNVFADIEAPSATVSLEAIAQRDPDLVLVLGDTADVRDLRHRAGWRVVRAVREGRVVAVDGSLFGRPSPRMPEAVTTLGAALAAGAAR